MEEVRVKAQPGRTDPGGEAQEDSQDAWVQSSPYRSVLFLLEQEHGCALTMASCSTSSRSGVRSLRICQWNRNLLPIGRRSCQPG
eukprot:3500184-Amphidinium_carterae.1